MERQARRTPFVGRERELETLAAALTETAAGRGGITMLGGGAGIGKTRTVEEFAARSDVEVLWGRSSDGEWWPPYGPWIEAVSGRVGAVADELGADAAVLAALLPELRQDFDWAPEDDVFRLYGAFTRLLGRLARPVAVLALEDLHYADAASLGLLQYVARFVRRMPALIVGSYRDEELELTHPLSQCLAELYGQRLCRRISVGKLSGEESARLLEELWGEPMPAGAAEAIAGATGGNPFFIEEVVRHLREEGLEPGDLPGWRAPETVRHAIGRRMARLSAETARMLSVASAFTSPFDFADLQQLTGLPEDVLLDCFDEAIQATMIRPAARGAESYEFTHTIVRHALYNELNPSRRARLHRRIARAIEQAHPGDDLAHAPELARQYHRSASLPGAASGIRYALAAADQARDRMAHDERVAFLRIAVDLAEGADPSVTGELVARLRAAEAEKAADVEPLPAGLTRRELEVLRLLAAGRTNREIADALVVSVHTVDRHVANIYGKIGAHNRATATQYAYSHRLLST